MRHVRRGLPGVYRLREYGQADTDDQEAAAAGDSIPVKGGCRISQPRRADRRRLISTSPGKTEILDEIIPRFTPLQVYQAILESLASEHAARMVAMKNATDSATELCRSADTWNTTKPASSRSPARFWILSAARKRWDKEGELGIRIRNCELELEERIRNCDGIRNSEILPED